MLEAFISPLGATFGGVFGVILATGCFAGGCAGTIVFLGVVLGAANAAFGEDGEFGEVGLLALAVATSDIEVGAVEEEGGCEGEGGLGPEGEGIGCHGLTFIYNEI